MATTSGARTKKRSTVRPAPRKQLPKDKDQDRKSVKKRVIAYIIVIGLMFAAFYAFQYFKMSQIRDSLSQQIVGAENANSVAHNSLKETLAKVRKEYPAADKFSADPAFAKAPLAGRLGLRTNEIIRESETDIRETRENTPFIFLTDILMPGAQKSTDDHYREAIQAHVSSPEFVEFNKTKLQVDDLMAAVRFCRGEKTELFYGYTDPVPDEETKQARAAAINGAAKRHLCP
jgi:hypothetical protein